MFNGNFVIAVFLVCLTFLIYQCCSTSGTDSLNCIGHEQEIARYVDNCTRPATFCIGEAKRIYCSKGK